MIARFIGVVAALSVGLAVAGASSASASVGLARVGSTPALPRSAQVSGPLRSTKELSLTVALAPQDRAGLQALATEVSTPGSALFRHYLSVAQFAQQFGASPPAIAAVRSALQAQGMAVGAVTANHLTLPVTATVAQAESAFSTPISRVKLSSGRLAYANRQAPTLAPGIARFVQGVIGLDDVNPDRPAGLSIRPGTRTHRSIAQADARLNLPTGGGPQPCSGAAAQQASNGLTADEVATAYQFSGLYGAGDLGAGQTIAMFEQQPYDPTDIATYQACYGTGATVSNVDVAGGPGPYAGDDGESALDIEQAIGLAPRANILVYQGPSTSTVQIISTIVSQDVAKVISSSYGLCEALTGGATISAESPLLEEAAVQGQSFFISSGDSGSNMCYQADQTNTSLSVIDPGGQPFATGVGGTTLFTNSGTNCPCYYTPGSPPAEGVWNDGITGGRASGSGGGISSIFAMPSYQSSAPVTLGVVNPNSSTQPCGAATFCREVPDVAADADPNTGYAIFSNGAWGITGGTSAAAPLWAAFAALTNASGTCRGLPVGFVNPALYSLAGSSYLNSFSDVTAASPITGAADNDPFSGTVGDPDNGLFPVTAGYDMATGLGSMIAPHLAASLCALRSPVFGVSVASPGGQETRVGQGVAVAVHAADAGGAGLFYTASGLPAGLSIDAATGVISGVTTTAEATTVTVTATDAYTNAGSTAFPWTVLNRPPPVGRPRTRSVKLSGLAAGRPRLSFTIDAGSHAAALRSISVSLPRGLSFASRTKSLDRGLAVRSGGRKVKFSVKVSHGVLTITFRSGVRAVSVSLGWPAIAISRSEASRIRRHKIKKLTLELKTVDGSRHVVRLAITLRKLS